MQGGYNWQYKNWVYGLETDFNFLNGQRAPNGTWAAPPSYAGMGVSSYTLTPESGGTYFSTFRARLGFAVDRTLFYATGGIANGGWRGASTLTLNGAGPANPFSATNSQSAQTKYALGAGVEYAFADNGRRRPNICSSTSRATPRYSPTPADSCLRRSIAPRRMSCASG